MHILLEDSNITYYWAGFLLADGVSNCKNSIRLQLAQKDIEHLKLYSNFIQCFNIKNIITTIPKYKDRQYYSCYLDYTDNIVVPQFKQKFDWKTRKTYNPPNINILEKMTDELFLSFLIGYIDGDGCIQYQSGRNDLKISFHVHGSWLSFIECINTRINTIFKYTKIKRPSILKTGFIRYDIGCIRTTRDLKKIAINYNLPILSRKWDKIDINMLHKYEKRDLLIGLAQSLRQNGFSLQDIANKLNTNYNTLCYHLYKRR